MPKGGCENARLMSSCCPVFTSGCARGWTCYTGMTTRAKILHVLQKQGIKKDEFSTPLHLVAFHRSHSSLYGHSNLRVDIAKEELRLCKIFFWFCLIPWSCDLPGTTDARLWGNFESNAVNPVASKSVFLGRNVFSDGLGLMGFGVVLCPTQRVLRSVLPSLKQSVFV